MNNHSKEMLDRFGRISLQTLPKLKTPIPLVGVYNDDNEDAEMLRRFAVRLADYLPPELIEKIDESAPEFFSGKSSADFTLSVEVIEQKLINWNECGRLDCSYLCSVRVYNPDDRYIGNLYKDWFRTESERNDITEVSVTRAKELLGKLLNPWELAYSIIRR